MSTTHSRLIATLIAALTIVASVKTTYASGPVGAIPGLDDITVAHARALTRVAVARFFITNLTPVNTFVVTSTADLPDADLSDNLFDPPTFRAAIENANKNSDYDLIVFNLSNATINVGSQLPDLKHPCMINGAGSGGDPIIIDGTGAGSGPGVWLNADGCVVQNLDIRNFPGAGLQLGSTISHRDMIVHNVRTHGNAGAGININRLRNSLIGGLYPEETNRVYNNTGSGGKGISFAGFVRSDSNVVIGNWIGTSNGMDTAGNSRQGVFIEVGWANIISNNIIVANDYGGLEIGDEEFNPTMGTVIEYNLIGVGSDGFTTIPNAGTTGGGIDQQYSRHDTIQCNVISGNAGDEEIINGTEARHMVIRDNLIGTSLDTASGLGTAFEAVLIFGDSNVVTHNIVTNNNRGVSIRNTGEYNTVQGNWCGRHERHLNLNANGQGVFIQGPNNLIGGPNPMDANMFCWNGTGVYMRGSACSSNVIQGNIFGLNQAMTDTTGLDNYTGIIIQGSASKNEIIQNAVCYSTGSAGVLITNQSAQVPNQNVIQNNSIGLSPVGLTPFPNRMGILITSGDSTQILENTIKYNDSTGVQVTAGSYNTILLNEIGNNGFLGIDLGGDGKSLNDGLGDPDVGPNMLQNYPVILAILPGATDTAQVRLESTPNRAFMLELFVNPTCDLSGNGEGNQWWDSVWVRTDSAGVANLAHDITGWQAGGNNFLTLTATDSITGNTSEFSQCGFFIPPPDTSDLAVTKDVAVDTVDLGDTVVFTMTLFNAGPDTATNVTMMDTLPSGLVYESHSGGAGVCSVNVDVVTCEYATLAPGAADTVILNLTSSSSGSYWNWAHATGTQVDIDPENNRDSALVTVICPIAVTGDVQSSGDVNTTDIIFLVNYVLKAGPEPAPCPAAGDANCDGQVNTTDIIYLVNYVLKAGPAPCDVCTLIPSMWSCP